jgi:hypothetical protein
MTGIRGLSDFMGAAYAFSDIREGARPEALRIVQQFF